MTDGQFNEINKKLQQIIDLLKPKPPITANERQQRIRSKLEEDRKRREEQRNIIKVDKDSANSTISTDQPQV